MIKVYREKWDGAADDYVTVEDSYLEGDYFWVDDHGRLFIRAADDVLTTLAVYNQNSWVYARLEKGESEEASK